MRVSEIFGSTIQGEGIRTGVQSVWVRLFGCSLQCKGFFQPDPTNESTYFPINIVDPKSVTRLEDLPVVEYGCDSVYSIDPRFKHLAKDYAPVQLAEEVLNLLPNRRWEHPTTGNDIDLAITGGEPLLWQKDIIKFLAAFDQLPSVIQIETNATRILTQKFIEEMNESLGSGVDDFCFNISPKLHTVSGEKSKDAWFPEIIKQYYEEVPYGCLKFVVNNTDACWLELDSKVKELRKMYIGYPIFVMPVGATKEQQEDSRIITQIARRAADSGYHISGRLHCNLFGNSVGV